MAEKITMQMITQLRERTGIGIAKCKEALEEANGDIELAISNLRKAGMVSAAKKEGRATNEGVIATAETNGTVAVVEIKAETDFVVKNDRFQQFSRDIATEVASTNPASLEAFLSQSYSKEGGMTVDEYRASVVQAIGENIQLSRLVTFQKSDDRTFGVYTHLGGKIVTVVEIAGKSGEDELARDVAMHIAAEAPEYVSEDQVPSDVVEHEKEIARSQMKGKPENIMDKIIDGKLNSFYNDICLIRQKYIKNDKMTIGDLVAKHSKDSGKELEIKQFIRWNIGQE